MAATARVLERHATVNGHPTAPPVELDLAARLAVVDALMTVRLQKAGLAVDVNTAHLPAVDLDLGEVVRLPTPFPSSPEPDNTTPVARLLQRARQLIVERGWCIGCSRDEQGALCLVGAVEKAAAGDRGLAVAGLTHVLDQIRRDLDPDAETVASWNDRQVGSRMPLQILGAATDTAAHRGI